MKPGTLLLMAFMGCTAGFWTLIAKLSGVPFWGQVCIYFTVFVLCGLLAIILHSHDLPYTEDDDG